MTANATDPSWRPPELASLGRSRAGAVLDGLFFVLTLGLPAHRRVFNED